MVLSQCCIDFDTKTYRFGHISGPSYRGAHAGWPGGWVVRQMPAMRLGHQEKRKKYDPFIKKCVENATPRAEIACLDALPQALGSISGRRKSHP